MLRWIRGVCGFLKNLTAFVAMLEKKRTAEVNEKPVVCIAFIREAKTHGEALTHTNESRKSEFSRDFYTFSKIFTFLGQHTRVTPKREKM